MDAQRSASQPASCRADSSLSLGGVLLSCSMLVMKYGKAGATPDNDGERRGESGGLLVGLLVARSVVGFGRATSH